MTQELITKELEIRNCEFCGSTHKVFKSRVIKRYVCNNHRKHVKKYGKVIQTKNSPNDVVFLENYVQITLTVNGTKIVGECLVDLDDYQKLKGIKLSKESTGYCVFYSNKKLVKVHRFVMGVTNPKDFIDHINGNRLDNRKENLRIVTPLQNKYNQKVRKQNSTGVKGVRKVWKSKTFQANITVMGKQKHLGNFKNIEDAKRVRELAEIQYQGEYRYKKQEVF